ncbi:MAG TPA: futalosine hydrolase, partial [Geobacteraceae bacterium]|nr:futalosine hydrolase [Geobacteraceae bacterium]
MKPVIVTAATPRELSLLISVLEGKERFQVAHRDAYRGEIEGRPAILAVTGIGKVNTAIAVTALLERFEPELLVNTGCAGAYRGSGLAVGDLALATDEMFGDEGVRALDGWHNLELIGIPAVERKGVSYFNRFPLTRWALDKAVYVAASAGEPIHQGTFVTVSTVSGTLERGEELSIRSGGICENMEGGAAAQAALLYGVDCMEVRGVS